MGNDLRPVGALLAAGLFTLFACGEPVADAPDVPAPDASGPVADALADAGDSRDLDAQKKEAMDRARAASASADTDAPEWVGGPGTLTIVYTNNIDGEIEPCG